MVLAAASLYLVIIGLLIQFSIHSSDRLARYQPKPITQVVACVIGLICLLVVNKLPMSVWRRFAIVGYIVVVMLMLVVRQTGVEVFGAKRWLTIGGFQLQPSELMKPVLVFVAAGLLVGFTTKNAKRRLAILLVTAALPIGLVLLQPDLGTALVLLALWACQIFVSGIDRRYIGFIAAVLVGVAAIGVPLSTPYQKQRVSSFITGHKAEDASSYNVVQARIAIGSGGWLGQGLSGGTQSQLNFLPSQHTDFAFSVVAEKLGFVGALSVLLAEVGLSIAAWRIVIATKGNYLTLVSSGIALVFTMQAVVNIAMNVGLLPVTGIPLPLISYGGTSMVVSLIMIGWLLHIDRLSATMD